MCSCKKRKLAKKVINLVKASDGIEIKDITAESSGRTTQSKQGIYFLYNNTDDIIYVGRIGVGNGTSLYDRCILGHGEPHITKSWGTEIAYVKFHKFDTLNEAELGQIEAIVICKLNPIYNTATVSTEDIKTILSKI